MAILFVEPRYFNEKRSAAAKRAVKAREERQQKAVERELKRRKAIDEDGRKRRRMVAGAAVVADDEAKAANDNQGPDVELSVFERLRVEYKTMMPKVQSDKVKKTSSEGIGPELDNMVNARGRGIGCYKAPVMAFYENDQLGGELVLVLVHSHTLTFTLPFQTISSGHCAPSAHDVSPNRHRFAASSAGRHNPNQPRVPTRSPCSQSSHLRPQRHQPRLPSSWPMTTRKDLPVHL